MVKLSKLIKGNKNKRKAVENISSEHDKKLDKTLKENLAAIKATVGNSYDIVIREINIGSNTSIKAAVLYTDGLVDKNIVNDFIMHTLMIDIREAKTGQVISNENELFALIKNSSLTSVEVNEVTTYKAIFEQLLSGDTIVLLDGFSKGFGIGSRGWQDRGVQEPSSQQVVRGPKDAFSETLKTNTALIRRRIKDPDLWMETQKIGKRTNTDVAIAYINGIVSEEIVKEVKQRLNKIDIDAILESGYIEELIQDETYTPFPVMYNSERPDSICAGLLEGKVAILVDGTPFVLLVPALFIDFFQSSEDYYQRSDISSAIRLLRFFCFFLALVTPSAYIALTTFHQEMIPTELLISIAAQREGVPFPALVEALIMEVTFEILREAGIRLPRAVGSAISIVGTLILGQAAVEAGIVSSTMVIVVSLTAISSFVSPTYNMAISVRMLRFIFIILAGTFGLFGIILGLIIMVLHLTSLRSFGIPYLSPMAPLSISDQKDALIRMPLWMQNRRPKLINQNDKQRANTEEPRPTR
ncbi:spore germination protein [Aquibacillus rhizosphaerae]|uniref:Spore germination protein n=1 Tax=Aquibacillus rhizosphaerae TaxID=3051431 RepID=A0ABT7L3Y3_9BACI|nr:spore germination protein [Aquibacillus sp. LR5S19]MDL4840581.1 spore germination protein [Aquibacillus sp. LR5S19]